MDFNQRDGEYLENRGGKHGGYIGKNSNPGSYRGSKGGNLGRPRGSKSGNVGGGGNSSFASPEMVKAVYLTALIPVSFVLLVAGYFTAASFGFWD